MKDLLHALCPPIVWNALRAVQRGRSETNAGGARLSIADKQDLELYWDGAMADVLETWGEHSVWNEIQLLMENCSGRVLDIACGPGKTIELLAGMSHIEVHGFDISDFLIEKAMNRGIPEERLRIADATKMNYADRSFRYSYSIGSLEHFTQDGIQKCLAEASRVTDVASFHMIPVSRSGRDEGWMKTVQTFHNNSVAWWLCRFQAAFATVHVVDSAWADDISVGKWFLCKKDGSAQC